MNAIATTHNRRGDYVTFSPIHWIAILAMCLLISGATKNSVLTFASLACLPIFVVLLWRVNEPPILFYAVGAQWVQVVMSVFDADLRGMTLQDYRTSWTIDEAVSLGIVALLCLSVGIRVGLRGLDSRNSSLDENVEILSIKKLWYAYLVVLSLATFAQSFAWVVPGLTQMTLVAAGFKWAVFFVLAITTLGQRRQFSFLIVAATIEFILGLTGFFAGFQTVFVVILIAFATYITFYKWKAVVASATIFLILLFLGIGWSAFKTEYRDFVTQGESGYSARADFGDRVERITELYVAMDQETFFEGVEGLIHRIAYVDYFSRVLETVPGYLPHSGGEFWGGAFLHVLTPRILFPDKEGVHSDTIMTEKYTQTNIIEQAGTFTTVPLGYVTESYIDFGRYLMFVPIALLGFVVGLMYKYFVSGQEPLFGYGMATVIIFQVNRVEVGVLKMLGGLLMSIIVMALIKKLIVPGLQRAVSAN